MPRAERRPRRRTGRPAGIDLLLHRAQLLLQLLILILHLLERAGELPHLIFDPVETHGEIAGIAALLGAIVGTAEELRFRRCRGKTDGENECEKAGGCGHHSIHSSARWKRQLASPNDPRIPVFNIGHGVRPKWGFFCNARNEGAARNKIGNEPDQVLPAFSTVTARRFCDQQEMSLQTATGRSLP